jgi:hypothetical protein
VKTVVFVQKKKIGSFYRQFPILCTYLIITVLAIGPIKIKIFTENSLLIFLMGCIFYGGLMGIFDMQGDSHNFLTLTKFK